ncbi:Pycsar system effector family protein [Streptomyces sp. NPDC127098]|uniref:Pycsar system effector family protein n=1 Tax=Streptomyces sp. NPDC127098 TaxID=3347137 RepID=UPI003659FFF7
MRNLPSRDIDSALTDAYNEAQSQIARTDAKTANLTTFIGLLLTGVTVAAGAMSLPPAARIVGGLGVATLMVAGGLLLWVARPRLKPRTPGTFPHWARLSAEQLLTALTIDNRAEAVVTLAKLAEAKHERVQRAVDLTLAAGGLLAIAALIAIGGAL